MDQHPIPQNVTGFQFKLIGKMTVKQFGYVAIGVIGAVIVYYIPIGGLLGILIKTILLPLFGASGAIVAFVPIDGRPIDVMAGNFMKAFFAPNQYLYHKTGVQFSFSKIKPISHTSSANQELKNKDKVSHAQENNKARELQKLLAKSYASKTNNPQDSKESAFLKSILLSDEHVTSTTQPTSHQPEQASIKNSNHIQASDKNKTTDTPVEEVQSENLTKKESELKQQLDVAKREESLSKTQQEMSNYHQKTAALEKQLTEIHLQKQALEQEIANLKNQLQVQKAPATSVITAPKKQPQIEKNKAHVRSIPADMNKKMGVLVSDTPNVIAGVVKDPRGNPLPNILVEIKDKADNPVRAFKTNALGNFASATPLNAGEYTILLEDPKKQQTFDEIKITLSDQIMLPLEIISYDKREQLRRELFN